MDVIAGRRWPAVLLSVSLLAFVLALAQAAGAQGKGGQVRSEGAQPSPSVTQPPVVDGSQSEGKEGLARPSGSPVTPSARPKPLTGSGRVGGQTFDADASTGDAAIGAVAMIAVLLVIGQAFVIVRQRRRIAHLRAQPSEELGGPRPSLEGT